MPPGKMIRICCVLCICGIHLNYLTTSSVTLSQWNPQTLNWKQFRRKKKKSAILTQICLCLIDTSCFFLFISFTSIVKRWRDFVCFPDKCRLSFTLCCYSNFVNVFIVSSSFINIQCCATRVTLCTCTSRRTFIQ